MKRFINRNEEHIPANFYNIKADLPFNLMPPLHPGTNQPLQAFEMEAIFPKGLIEHETTQEKFVSIPSQVLEKYAVYRPTPLIKATELMKYLDTPAEIYYKYEGVSPAGSHKVNTAIMQAYMAKQEGIKQLFTETGAGQWGSSLAIAGKLFDIDISVFMVRSSFNSKPGRKIMMEMHGAKVLGSPSNTTLSGQSFLAKNQNHPGSLGIAISEAVENVVINNLGKYALGSVLDSVILHQTIIGEETLNQMQALGVYPDVVIACVGGGSNFGGIAFPFLRENIKNNKNTRLIAVEPTACPSLTKGELRYDFGDSSGYTPLLYMHTLGKDFVPAEIHAGGLRYHGMSPIVSQLYHNNMIEAIAYQQEEIFDAAKLFLKTEGILPAPESSHAIKAAIDEAMKAKKENKKTKILFNLSGHGFFDINAYIN